MQPTTIYLGKREAMIAEVSAFEATEGKWLVMPDGDAQWDTEGFPTKAYALMCAKEWARHTGAKIVFVS